MTYVTSALDAMDERGAACAEARPQVQDVFNAEMQERLQGSVWNSGASSWYLDAVAATRSSGRAPRRVPEAHAPLRVGRLQAPAAGAGGAGC